MSATVQQLEDRIMELEDLLGMSEPIPPMLRIQKAHETILSMLLNRESVTKDALTVALYQGGRTNHGNEPSPKSIEVQICHLRKALRQHGVEIETYWGRGYFMVPEMKRKCRALFESMREAA